MNDKNALIFNEIFVYFLKSNVHTTYIKRDKPTDTPIGRDLFACCESPTETYASNELRMSLTYCDELIDIDFLSSDRGGNNTGL